MRTCNQICFITGTPQCGKTSLLKNIISYARSRELTLGGFMAIGLWQDNRRSGFILEELESGLQTPLSGRSPESREMGGYVFYPEGFAKGLATLTPEALAGKDLIAVDEVGWLETRGDGWAPALPALTRAGVKQIWVVRDAMIPEVCATWEFEPLLIVHPEAYNAETQILKWLKI